MDDKITPKELDDLITASIIKGVQTSRLPMGFVLSKHAKETIKNAVWLKIEEGKPNTNEIVVAMVVAFNIGYSEGMFNGMFEGDIIDA